MSQFNEGPEKSFTAGAAIAQHIRVKLASGKLAVAGATDQDIGVLRDASFADGDVRAVRLVNCQGTQLAVSAAAIAEGAKVYTAASGKVSSTQATGAFLRGIALHAVGAADRVIEILPLVGDTAGS